MGIAFVFDDLTGFAGGSVLDRDDLLTGAGPADLPGVDAERSEVEYKGPRWLKGTAIASPGKPAEIPVPNVGLVRLIQGGKELAVAVESHAHIRVKM